ncbi:hypothetical protein N7540_004807 [Penicillium herquei]|nr:hypothetical protein N7540_004807 [Penicillium herquei]
MVACYLIYPSGDRLGKIKKLESIDLLPAIFKHPMVLLLHNYFGSFNILVDENSCNLNIDLKHGWSRYDDYRPLNEPFWATFSQETGMVNAIKAARIAGVSLWLGFTSRLSTEPKPVPISISDYNESGTYGIRLRVILTYYFSLTQLLGPQIWYDKRIYP